MADPLEIIVAPFDVYFASTGVAFPDCSTTPDSNWTKLGKNGNRNYTESGVVLTLSQTLDYHRTYGTTGPVKASRSMEDLKIAFTILDLRPQVLTQIMLGAAVTADGFDQYVGISRGRTVTEFALLIRGDAASPKYADLAAQFEVPRCIYSGNPAITFAKTTPAGIAFEFTALEDEDAAVAQRFGRYRIQYMPGSTSASTSPSASESASPSPSVG